MSDYNPEREAGAWLASHSMRGSPFAKTILDMLVELEQLRTQQGEAVGWITEEGLFTKVPVTVFIKTGKWTPVYLHPPADQAIGVPTSELEKLEASRVALYDFLDTKLDEFEMQDLINITGQIWKVANTKKWQAPADNTVRVPADLLSEVIHVMASNNFRGDLIELLKAAQEGE